MKTLALLVCLFAAIPACSQSKDPAKVLFDTRTQVEQTEKLQRAKILLLTLVATYPHHMLTDKAKVENGALYLFLDAQAQVKAGEVKSGYFTFRTVASVYPESPLSKLATKPQNLSEFPATRRDSLT